MKNKMRISSFLALGVLLQVLFLYKTPVVLFITLAIYNGVILFLEKNNTLYRIFFFSALCGPLSEILAVFFGVWAYSFHPFFFGIPLWLLLVWGHAGIYLYKIGMYFDKKYKKHEN